MDLYDKDKSVSVVEAGKPTLPLYHESMDFCEKQICDYKDEEGRKKNNVVILGILFLSLIGSGYFMFRGPINPGTDMPQSVEEIRLNMELMGYENTVFGPEVKALGNNFGPCLTFTTTYKGDILKGGYCTLKFKHEQWGPVVMSREVANLPEVINGSYQK